MNSTPTKEKGNELKGEIEMIKEKGEKIKEEVYKVKEEVTQLKNEYNSELSKYKEITSKIMSKEKEYEKISKEKTRLEYKQIEILSTFPQTDSIPNKEQLPSSLINSLNILLTSIPNDKYLYFDSFTELQELLESSSFDVKSKELIVKEINDIKHNDIKNFPFVHSILNYYENRIMINTLQSKQEEILNNHMNISKEKDVLFLILKDKESSINQKYINEYKQKTYIIKYINSILKQFALYQENQTKETLIELKSKIKKLNENKVQYKPSTTQKSNLNVTIKTEYSEENSIDDTSSILSSSIISYSRNPNSSSIFAKEKLNTYFTSKKQNHIDTSKMDISSNNKSNIDDYALSMNNIKALRSGKVNNEKGKIVKNLLQFDKNINNENDCCTSCT